MKLSPAHIPKAFFLIGLVTFVLGAMFESKVYAQAKDVSEFANDSSQISYLLGIAQALTHPNGATLLKFADEAYDRSTDSLDVGLAKGLYFLALQRPEHLGTRELSRARLRHAELSTICGSCSVRLMVDESGRRRIVVTLGDEDVSIDVPSPGPGAGVALRQVPHGLEIARDAIIKSISEPKRALSLDVVELDKPWKDFARDEDLANGGDDPFSPASRTRFISFGEASCRRSTQTIAEKYSRFRIFANLAWLSYIAPDRVASLTAELRAWRALNVLATRALEEPEVSTTAPLERYFAWAKKRFSANEIKYIQPELDEVTRLLDQKNSIVRGLGFDFDRSRLEAAIRSVDSPVLLHGLHAELFRASQSEEFVLVFRGSDEAYDWFNNLWQGTVTTVQAPGYEGARKLVAALISGGIPRERLAVVGHSYGGGLAQYAHITNSTATAVTFNSAFLGSASLSALNAKESRDASKRISNVTAVAEQGLLAGTPKDPLFLASTYGFAALFPQSLVGELEYVTVVPPCRPSYWDSLLNPWETALDFAASPLLEPPVGKTSAKMLTKAGAYVAVKRAISKAKLSILRSAADKVTENVAIELVEREMKSAEVWLVAHSGYKDASAVVSGSKVLRSVRSGSMKRIAFTGGKAAVGAYVAKTVNDWAWNTLKLHQMESLVAALSGSAVSGQSVQLLCDFTSRGPEYTSSDTVLSRLSDRLTSRLQAAPQVSLDRRSQCGAATEGPVVEERRPPDFE